jgi:hypothetical protein
MTTKTEQIESVRGLARQLNRAHTTVGRWLTRDDWPFKPSPPWPLSIVPEVEQWAEDNLQEDRNAEQAHNRDVVPAPGFTLTGHDIASERTPFHLKPLLIPAQYATLTMADFEAFALIVTVAFKLVMEERCAAIGEGELLPEAPAVYYGRLMPSEDDSEQWERLLQILNIAVAAWLDRRFSGTPGYEPYNPEAAKRKGAKRR